MTEPGPAGDDSLDVLRGLGRTIVGICLFLVLAGATLVVGNGSNESFSLTCAHTADTRERVNSVRYDTRWFPPRLVCITTSGDGLRTVATLPLSTRTVTVFAVLTTAWIAAVGFALAVAVRPARIRLLDRIAATWLLGVLSGITLLRIVVSIGRRYLDAAPAPLHGVGRASQPEWLFSWVVACVVVGAVLAAARAHRASGAWLAAVSTALTIGVYLIFTTVIHPLRLLPSGALAAGFAAGAVVQAGRAVNRLKESRNGPIDT